MNDILQKINRELGDYYAARSSDGDASVQVGWKNRQAQENRFAQIAKVVPEGFEAPFSVNDLGCGLGDFAGYLEASGFSDFSYRGYDMSDAMLSGARAANGARKATEFFKIRSFEDMQEADFTVASGIFNLRFTIPEHEWLYYVLDAIGTMNARSKSGFSFNVLSKYSDASHMRSELYYADPSFLFDYCKRNFSRNVALLHDYNEYDFTVIVRKA